MGIHYGRDHSKEDLDGKKIPVVPVAHYSRRIVQRDPEKSSLMANIEREIREAFLELDEGVRDEVLRI